MKEHGKRTSRGVMLAAIVVAACAGGEETGAREETITTATTDFGDAVVTSTLGEGSGTIVTVVEDPDQVEALLVLEWDVDDGAARWYPPEEAPVEIPADDVRLQQSPTLESANRMAYEQWLLGDDAFSCYCTRWRTSCYGYWVCEIVQHCVPDCQVILGEYMCSGETCSPGPGNCYYSENCSYDCSDWNCWA